MVKQIRTPKTSSATKAFLKRVQQVSSVQEYWALIQETKNKKVIEEFLNLQSFERRKELLVELANMHDEGFERFCIPRRWGFRFFQTQAALTKSDVFKLRDSLRQVWRPELPIVEKEAVIQKWLVVRQTIPAYPQRPFSRIGASSLAIEMWKPVLQAGKIEPAFDSLPAQLIQGVLEQHSRLAVCKNPGCPAPYFLAKRSDQKYCEQGTCTAYAQRKYNLGYWHLKGKFRSNRKTKSSIRKKVRRRLK